MDEETVDLILGLQIEDLQSLVATRKGKAVEGSPATDEEVAIEIQINELQAQRRVMGDIFMARSISRAVQDDGTTIAILADEERRSVYDRQMATRLSGRPLEIPLDVPDCRVDEDILSKFDSLNICQSDTMSCYSESVVSFTGAEAGESSSWASSRRTGKSSIQHECIACFEVRETVQVRCQHRYCRVCVTRLITDATIDESLFPPRCCGQPMPLSLVRPFISVELAAKIQLKAIEYGTPYRTYCTSCGVFIKLADIEGHRGHCSRCDQDTCILCKGRYHDGDCPRDAALESVLRLAREAKWQQCFGCQALVERREGCNHIV